MPRSKTMAAKSIPIVFVLIALVLLWARLRRVAADGLTVTILLVYGGFAGFVAWVVGRMPRGGDWPMVTTATVLLLLMFLALIVRGLLDRWQGRAARRVAVHDIEREW